jgi:hypothetical protein
MQQVLPNKTLVFVGGPHRGGTTLLWTPGLLTQGVPGGPVGPLWHPFLDPLHPPKTGNAL